MYLSNSKQGSPSFAIKLAISSGSINYNFHIFFRFFLVNIYTIFFSNQKLLKVARIKYIGNVAWAHQTNYIPIKYLPDVNIDDMDSFKELATMIRKKYRIDIHQEKSKKNMKVIVDTPEEIANFIAKDGEPCFEFDRYTYFADGKIFEYVKIFINYKYYSLTIKD